MRRSFLFALVIVVLVYPGTAWAQQTIYGCVKNNNGQIRIVAAGEACLPSEHAIQWSASAPSPAVVPGPTTTTPGPLRVVDQTGAPVGVLVAPGVAARQVGDLWLSLPVNPMGFQAGSALDYVAFYQTDTCSGDAYLPVETGSLLRTGMVLPNTSGKLQFWYAGATQVDGTTIQGMGRYDGNTWTCQAFAPGPWLPLFGKVTTLDLSTLQAPFKITQ